MDESAVTTSFIPLLEIPLYSPMTFVSYGFWNSYKMDIQNNIHQEEISWKKGWKTASFALEDQPHLLHKVMANRWEA